MTYNLLEKATLLEDILNYFKYSVEDMVDNVDKLKFSRIDV